MNAAAEDRIFHALADPSRRAIFESLTRGEAAVKDLTARFEISQPAVSQHLATLKRAGLVNGRRAGRCVYYRVDPRGIEPLIDWIAHYRAFWTERMDRPGEPAGGNGRMNPIDQTEKGQSGTIAFAWDLPHPPEKVWRALTDPELVARWLLPPAGFDLTPGAEFTLHADPQPGWDGVVHCRLLESEQRRKLSYTWKVGELDTVVTFTLEPTGTGTHLAMRQSGFRPDQKRNFGGARYGWRMMGEKLVTVLDDA